MFLKVDFELYGIIWILYLTSIWSFKVSYCFCILMLYLTLVLSSTLLYEFCSNLDLSVKLYSVWLSLYINVVLEACMLTFSVSVSAYAVGAVVSAVLAIFLIVVFILLAIKFRVCFFIKSFQLYNLYTVKENTINNLEKHEDFYKKY